MKWGWIIIGVLVVGFVSIFAASVFKTIKAFERSYESTVQIEVQTPLFSVRNLVENKTALVDLCSDSLVVLHYWATWCKPCIEDFKAFEQFYDQNKDLGIFFVVSNEAEEKVLSFIGSNNYNLPFSIIETGEKIFNNEVTLYPSTFFIKNCEIKRIITGKIDWSKLDFNSISVN